MPWHPSVCQTEPSLGVLTSILCFCKAGFPVKVLLAEGHPFPRSEGRWHGAGCLFFVPGKLGCVCTLTQGFLGCTGIGKRTISFGYETESIPAGWGAAGSHSGGCNDAKCALCPKSGPAECGEHPCWKSAHQGNLMSGELFSWEAANE